MTYVPAPAPIRRSGLFYTADGVRKKVSYSDLLAWVSYSDTLTWLKFHKPADNCRLKDSVIVDIGGDADKYDDMLEWKGTALCGATQPDLE